MKVFVCCLVVTLTIENWNKIHQNFVATYTIYLTLFYSKLYGMATSTQNYIM